MEEAEGRIDVIAVIGSATFTATVAKAVTEQRGLNSRERRARRKNKK